MIRAPGGLVLREAVPDDAARIARWKGDPLVRRMALGRGPAATEEGERGQIERAQASDRELYLVIELEGSAPIGYVRVNWIDEEREVAWLRFALGERRGEGHARAALAAFLAYLFARGVHRVEAEAYDFNERSLRLLEGLGFIREGRKREAVHDDEGWHDLIAFGLLAGEAR